MNWEPELLSADWNLEFPLEVAWLHQKQSFNHSAGARSKDALDTDTLNANFIVTAGEEGDIVIRTMWAVNINHFQQDELVAMSFDFGVKAKGCTHAG